MAERESHIITDRMDPGYVPPALTMNTSKIITDHDAARATARRFNQAGAHCRVEYSVTYGQYMIVMTQDVADRLADHIDTMALGVENAKQAGRAEAARDIRNMGTQLGDTGWAELERCADAAEWPRSYLREMRNDDRSFATCTVEVAYQSTRDRAAKIAEGKRA